MTPTPASSGTTARRPRPGRLDPDELAALEDQRDFLLRSLEDLEREHAAGDLDEHDYRTLRDDYTSRAAETLRAIDEQRAAFAEARRPGGRRRTLLVLGGVIVFAVVAGFLVASSLGARKAGETASGGISVSKSPSQRAQECIRQLDPAPPIDPTDAVDCFEGVLDDDPRNVVAKTWLGWQIELFAGDPAVGAQAPELQASAQRLVDDAVADDPDYSYARAFRAVLAFRRQDYALAKQYLVEFRERNPSPDAESVITQFDLDAQIEAALAGGPDGSTTTVPGSTTTAPG